MGWASYKTFVPFNPGRATTHPALLYLRRCHRPCSSPVLAASPPPALAKHHPPSSPLAFLAGSVNVAAYHGVTALVVMVATPVATSRRQQHPSASSQCTSPRLSSVAKMGDGRSKISSWFQQKCFVAVSATSRSSINGGRTQQKSSLVVAKKLDGSSI